MPSFSSTQRSYNIPTPLSTFIGREPEIAEVKQLLSTHRLVTLTGAGGSGKTRLALKVAGESLGKFEHGIWFVELASIADPTFVLQTIASTLNIYEKGRQSLLDVLINYLSARNSLLILDNCEHLISACAQLSETILQKCPGLKILVTSREVLGITGEAAWILPSLSLPSQQPWINPASAQDALNLYEESESVQLFVARAQASSPEFRLTSENGGWVAEVCRRLDGMPLAIELAAARVRALSVQQIAERLDDRFHLLTGGSRTAPARQQTLASALDWSYALLSVTEQKVLQRVSIFAGGASLEAAEWVCAGEEVESAEVLDALSHLVDKSLLMADKPETGDTRYRLLETIRQYALEKLAESGEMDGTKDRYLHYFVYWAEKVEPSLNEAEQLHGLHLYEVEHDNLCNALEWCSKDEKRDELGLRLAAACGRFWRVHGHLSEGRLRLSTALSKTGAQQRTITRAHALTLLANHIYLQSDYPAMHAPAEEALSIWRELGAQGKAGAAFALDLLGELATEEGDYESAPRLFQEALEIYEELNDLSGIGQIHMQFGWNAMRTGDLHAAESHLEKFLTLAQAAGDQASLVYAFSGL
ncbi:MAG TPA: NB-ARC domain-containing protein, partial [Anaerolineales bacterium]|nr:NB-ARC domain-containing protein [Anaerolineales bacterium]